jgi:hypothetical protein
MEFVLRAGYDDSGNSKSFYSDPSGWAFTERALLQFVKQGILVHP